MTDDVNKTAGPADSKCGVGARPQPISTLPQIPGISFIGLVLQEATDGSPIWEIDHYQFVAGPTLMNRNSANYTNALLSLTHWMPEPEFPG